MRTRICSYMLPPTIFWATHKWLEVVLSLQRSLCKICANFRLCGGALSRVVTSFWTDKTIWLFFYSGILKCPTYNELRLSLFFSQRNGRDGKSNGRQHQRLQCRIFPDGKPVCISLCSGFFSHFSPHNASTDAFWVSQGFCVYQEQFWSLRWSVHKLDIWRSTVFFEMLFTANVDSRLLLASFTFAKLYFGSGNMAHGKEHKLLAFERCRCALGPYGMD